MDNIFDIQRFASDSPALSVIKKFMGSLDTTISEGTEAIDEAIKACSNFSSAQDAINSLVNDCKNSESAKEFLKNYCDIDLSNADTGAITGKDAGGDAVKTASSVVPESGSGSYPASTTFTKRGLTVTVPEKSTLTGTQQIIVQGLYSWWIEESLKLVEESFGYSFSDEDVSVANLTIKFIDDSSSGNLAYTRHYYYSTTGKATQLELTINSAYFSNITADNLDGEDNYGYLDRTVAHELTHVIMAAKVNNFHSLPSFVTEGLAEIVHGIDDIRTSAISYLAANSSELESALESDYTTNYSVAAGYIFMRYLAKQASETDSLYIEGTSGANEINNTLDNATINALAGNDTIENTGQNVSIAAGAGNDKIYITNDDGDDGAYIDGGADDDLISFKGLFYSTVLGNDGDDTISGGIDDGFLIDGGAGADLISVVSGSLDGTGTIKGGKGNDSIYINYNTNSVPKKIIQYTKGDGNDFIYGINSSDTLQISGAKYSTTKSGNDLIIGVGTDSITVSGGANVAFTIDGTLESGGVTLPAGWNFSSNSAVATLSTAKNLDLNQTYGKNIKNIDASKISGGIEIIGNDLNNSIKGGKGNDTIYGGAGNDTVSLGAGKDTYFYSGGNDFIQDYAVAQDKIYFETEITGASLSGSNLIISTNEGKVTVKSVKGKKVSVTDSTGSFDIIDSYSTVETDIIYGSEKADNLSNADDEVIIDALAGNDFIDNTGSFVSINGGKGNDNISNTGDDVTIEGGAGRDKIFNEGYYTTIIGGKDNDTVENYGENILYQYAQGDGNDTILGFGESDTLHITKGTYSYSFSGGDLIVKVDSNTVTLKNISKQIVNLMDAKGNIEKIDTNITLPDGWKYGTSSTTNSNKAIITATVKGADDIDLNENYGEGVEKVDGSKTSGVVIFGNDLDNSIKGGTGNNTLGGGDGNDIIVGNTGADVFVYSGGDDRIINYVGGSGKDSVLIDIDNIAQDSKNKIEKEISGDDIIYYIDGAGTLTLQNSKDKKITLMDSNGTEIILDTIPAGWRVDSSKKILQATTVGAENEIDLNDEYGDGIEKVDGSQISGGVHIVGNDLKNSLKGGVGNDYLDGGAGNDILVSGAGNDTLVYSGGDDTITDYSEGHDSIQIDTQEIEILGVSTVGTNVIYYTDAGNLTVAKGKDKTITLMDANGDEIILDTIPAGWKVDSSKKILQATTAGAENEIDLGESYGNNIEKVDGSKISGGVIIYGNDLSNSIVGGRGADIIAGGDGNDTVSLGAGADIYIYSGGDDVIKDYSAGNDSVQIDTLNVEITGVGTVDNDIIFSTNVGNLKISKGADKEITLMDIDGKLIKIDKGETLPAGISVKNSIVTASTKFTGKEIDLDDYPTATKVNAAALSRSISIIGNSDDNILTGGKGADTIFGGEGNDTVSLGGGKDFYIYSGGNDLIQDYTAGQDKIKLESGYISGASLSSSNVVLNISTGGKITVKNGKNKKITVIDSNGNENSNIYPTLPAGISVKNSIVTAAKTFTGKEINLADYNATKVNASALTSGISIVGTAAANSLKGGTGNDTIFGGKGNDTINLGNGKDIYIYSEGNDLIQDYTAGQDKIKLSSGSISGSSISGSNVILNISNGGKVTLSGGKDKKITVIDSDNNETTNIYPGSTIPTGISVSGATLTASTKFTGNKIDLADYSGVTKVNAAALSKNISIVGSSADNVLKGGKGADTIFGGAGNDTLTGGAGKDVYIYSGGNDVITDYTAGQDKIKIEGTISKTTYSGTDIIFTIDDGSLTVKKGKGKKITVIDSNGTKTYSKTADLFYDNNFISDDTNLDSITEQKFSVTNIENTNTDTFAQVSVLAYSENK